MNSKSLTVRSVGFAYLFGPCRFVAREEASRVHAGICDRLGHDDITFAYRPLESTRGKLSGFTARMERREGRGAFTIVLDNSGPRMPMRLFVSHSWPETLLAAGQTFDSTVDAVFTALEGDWLKILAETNIRAQCEVKEENGLQFLRNNVLRSESWPGTPDGSLASCSVRFSIRPPGPHRGAPAGPERVLCVEPLTDDPRSIYLELVSRWVLASAAAAPESREIGRQTRDTRSVERKPGECLQDAYDFLKGRVREAGAGSFKTEAPTGSSMRDESSVLSS